jgi:hypothetical protein
MTRIIFNKLIKKTPILLLLLLINTLGFTQGINNDVKNISDQFYYDLNGNNGAIKNYYEINTNGATNSYVVNYEQGGFVIISNNKVTGFSEFGEYEIEGSQLEALLNDFSKTEVNGDVSTIGIQNTQLNKSLQSEIDPFLTDIWGGVNCYDNYGVVVYPGNYYTPSHCSPGCVAISLSQVLYHYKWPIEGIGSNVYSDNYNGTLKRHAFFHDNIQFDWNNMLDAYQGEPSTDSQRKAIGKLFFSVDCALEMNFEPSGSTSNINQTPFVYSNYYRFTSHYEDVTWSSFWDRLYDNIQSGYPVPVAVDASATGDGHVFVVNGYKEINDIPYYYLNWGWYNSNNINGWYNIEGWTSSSPGYNTITGATFDIMPNPQITSIENNNDGDDFIVNWEVSETINWDEFTLEQKMDDGDWTEVASGITSTNYTINNPTGNVYQYRVKVMIDGNYYDDSWSEISAFAVVGGFDGYADFGGMQYAYARQTPDNDLNFTGDYTFETWIRLKNSNSNNNVILDQQGVFAIEITDVTSINYSVKFKSHSTGATLNSGESGEKLLKNEWAHVAITHSGNSTKLYIDGEMRHEDTGSNFNLSSSDVALNIGERWNSGYSGRIKADLDQIRISSTARYSSNFIAIKEQIYDVDVNTIVYLNFQNVHKVRLKDAAHNLSVIVKNEPGYVEWMFEESEEILSGLDFELVKSSINVYPNPVTNNTLQVSFSSELNLENIAIEIYDISGRKININSVKNASNIWNVSFANTSIGHYILVVRGNGFKASKKIIIK